MNRSRGLAALVAAIAGTLPAWLARAYPLEALPAARDGTDPVAQAAHLAHATRHLPGSEAFWNAPWLHPGSYAQLYLDPMVGPSLVARLVPGAGPALDYHVALWFTVSTAVLAMAWCGRRVGLAPIFALAAGVVYAVGPYAAGHFHHLNQVPSAGLPLALGALVALVRGERPWGAAAVFVAGVALQTSWSLYGTAALGLGAVVLVAGLRLDPAARRPALVAITGAGLVLVVAAIPYLLAGRVVDGFGREATEAMAFQARWFDLWKAAAPRLLPWPEHDPLRPALYPGLGLVALAAVGVARGRDRRWAWTAVAVAGVGLGFAFGRTFLVPFTDLEIPLPYQALQDLVWPLRALRDPSRFGILMAWALCLLAGAGAQALWATRRGAAAVLLAVGALDAAPGAFDRVRVNADAPVVEGLRALPADAVWTLWPMPCDETSESARDARAMLWAVASDRRAAAGASGFVPPAIAALREANCDGLDPDALRAAGVGWVVSDGAVDGRVHWTDGTWSLFAVEGLSAEGDRR